MRKILFSFLFVLCLTGTTLAYTPSEKDTITIDTITKKVEMIISRGISRVKFIHALESFKEKQRNNEKISYLINAVIERLQAIENSTYIVTAVIDGDTIKVIRNNESKTIRIIGIDTPEKYPTRTGYEECYGKEASDFATKTLSWQTIIVEWDSTQDTIDKYGRTLGHIFFSWSTYYESLAIREGYGFHYTYKTPSKYDEQLKIAEEEAKKNIVWVWKYCEGKRKPIVQSGSIITTETSTSNIPIMPNTINIPTMTNSFSCSSKKTYCTEMKSCEEAKYYLNSCGINRLDQDGDGIPCESLCQ